MKTLTRRSVFQQGDAMVAAGWAVPSFIAETSRVLQGSPSHLGDGVQTAHAAGRKVLVIIQLAGGNDGLNTVVPFADPRYYASDVRPGLALPRSSVLALDDRVGLHPSLSGIKARYDRGQVAVVQGVSYPNPDRSHFRGTDIWESAVPDRLEPKGWAGRYLQACGCQRADHLEAMTVGSSESAGSFWTEMALVPAVASLGSFRYVGAAGWSGAHRDYEIQTLRTALSQSNGRPEAELLRQGMLSALETSDVLQTAARGYNPSGSYPSNTVGQSLKLVAQLVAADVGTSIFYVSLGGFDTHAAQLGLHAGLLSTLDRSIEAFLQDMERVGKLGDVALMTFSEFGRRLAQNGSGGSDHGIAAPMFVIGGGVRGGLHGQYPSLTDLTDGDLKMQVDFRSVYGTIIQDWLGASPTTVLGGTFPLLGIFNPASAPPPTPVPVPPTPVPPAPAGVQTTRGAGGQLQVTLSGRGGTIRAVRFGAASNALIEVGGQPARSGDFTYTPPTPTAQIGLTIRRVAASVAATVPLVIVDAAGEWPTFVGGGPGAF